MLVEILMWDIAKAWISLLILLWRWDFSKSSASGYWQPSLKISYPLLTMAICQELPQILKSLAKSLKSFNPICPRNSPSFKLTSWSLCFNGSFVCLLPLFHSMYDLHYIAADTSLGSNVDWRLYCSNKNCNYSTVIFSWRHSIGSWFR